MTDRYLYSGSAQDDSDSTWNSSTISYLTRQAVLDAYVAGDICYEAHDNTEGPATLTWIKGTGAATTTDKPVFIRTNRSTNVYSPTTGSDTKNADCSTSGADISFDVSMSLKGQYLVADDWFIASDLEGVNTDFEDCKIEIISGNNNLYLGTSANSGSFSKIKNTTFNFINATGCVIYFGYAKLIGCTFLGHSLTAGLLHILFSTRSATPVIEDCDFSQLSSATTRPLIDLSFGGDTAQEWHLINCNYASGQTIHDGAFVSDSQFVYLWSCDIAGKLYQTDKYCFRGDVNTDVSTYMSGGYEDQDGTTALSMEMVPASNVKQGSPLISIDIPFYVSSTGSKTFTVNCLENYTSAITKRDAWVEILVLDNASEVNRGIYSDREIKETSYTNLATNSETWTESLTGERTVELTASATVNQAGMHVAKIYLEKYESGKQFFYDPDVIIT